MPDVGQGIIDRMDKNSDTAMMDSTWGANKDGSQWERCWGLKGLYLASNASGQWEVFGPFGGEE
jgi:hypothetical protein